MILISMISDNNASIQEFIDLELKLYAQIF